MMRLTIIAAIVRGKSTASSSRNDDENVWYGNKTIQDIIEPIK